MFKLDRNPRSSGVALLTFAALAALLLVPTFLTAEENVSEGITVGMKVEPVRAGEPLQEGTDVKVSFLIKDTATGAPLSGLYPAAWMDRLPQGTARGEETCTEKVSTFLGGSLFSQPELNLNVFYVLGLNDDATISVVDPLFGFGNTKLLALVNLESAGEDWVIDSQRRRLYVSMPDSGKVAIVDTDTWSVIANVETAGRPARLALEPDGDLLWVADMGSGPGSVSAVDLETLRLAARLPAGEGDKDLALSSEGKFAYVTARSSGTVTVVDTRDRTVVATVISGRLPVSVAFSGTGNAAYVSHAGDGSVAVIDGKSHRVVARIPVEEGIEQIRFAPGDRFAFVVSPLQSRIHILDAATQRKIQTAKVEEEPDQVAFSDGLAYVRHQGDETVLMIPLEQVGVEGNPLSVVDFPGGQALPREGAPASRAASIIQAPSSAAVLVANPADQMIYFYKEGMAAPMGSFRNYGRQPRAVQVVDRSLHETEPGLYVTTAKLRRAGEYDVAFFLDAPKLVHCFELQVQPDQQARAAEKAAHPRIRSLVKERKIAVGALKELRFRVEEPVSGAAMEGLKDLQVLTYLGPGLWQKRAVAEPQGNGVYSVSFTPPAAGIYYVFLESRSLGIAINRGTYLTLEASEGDLQDRKAAERSSRIGSTETVQETAS